MRTRSSAIFRATGREAHDPTDAYAGVGPRQTTLLSTWFFLVLFGLAFHYFNDVVELWPTFKFFDPLFFTKEQMLGPALFLGSYYAVVVLAFGVFLVRVRRQNGPTLAMYYSAYLFYFLLGCGLAGHGLRNIYLHDTYPEQRSVGVAS